MDPIRKLIRQRIADLDLNLRQVSLELGRNHAYLQQFLERGIPADLPEKVRPRLARILQVSEEDLLPLSLRAERKLPAGRHSFPLPDGNRMLGPGERRAAAPAGRPQNQRRWLQGFVSRLRQAREDAGLSAEALAAELGIPLVDYQSYEKNQPLPIALLPAVCTALRVDCWFLLTGRFIQDHLTPTQLSRAQRGRL